MTRGVPGEARSPLSEEIKGEIARVTLAACDRRVLADLLPRAGRLGLPAQRLVHGLPALVGVASLAKACCRRTYLRGLFLAGGSLSSGNAGNMLELRPPRGSVARAREVLAREGFGARERSRRARTVFSLRDGDAIASFLRAIGSSETLLRFETRRVARDFRARTNAAVNADAANLGRAVTAARIQLGAIHRLAASRQLATLPAPIRDAARARVRAPTATLAELAAKLGVTKWAVRARLRTLMEVDDS